MKSHKSSSYRYQNLNICVSTLNIGFEVAFAAVPGSFTSRRSRKRPRSLVLEGSLDLIQGLLRPGGDLNLYSSLAIIFDDLILLMLTNQTLRIVVSNPLSTFGVRTKIKLFHTIRGLDAKSVK